MTEPEFTAVLEMLGFDLAYTFYLKQTSEHTFVYNIVDKHISIAPHDKKHTSTNVFKIPEQATEAIAHIAKLSKEDKGAIQNRS